MSLSPGADAPSSGSSRRPNRLVEWLDRRSGVRALLREALDEPIPGGARLAYIFGSGLLFLFLSQVISGVFLAMYYVPSADHAHTTVAYIVKEVSSGSFLRSLHAYGSSAMIIVLSLHVGQTILFGSYKKLRELLWLAGCGLFVLVLGMSFTGYLLPWDQKAYFATAVGTNILGEVPLVGAWLQRFVRGGTDMGTLTVSRFYVFHVFFLPAAIFTLIAAHVYLFRRAGAAGPPVVPPPNRTESFYPRQVLLDLAFTLLLMGGLGLFAVLVPAELGPEANPADTQFLPRPEWYYVPVFQWLKYWAGPWAVIGIVVIPGILGALFLGLPFLDRGQERRPSRRPWVVGTFLVVVAGLTLLGLLSAAADRRDPAIALQVERQREQARVFADAPFEPAEPGGSRLTLNALLTDPERARGKSVFEAEACDVCHGAEGIGTSAGPAIVSSAAKFPGDELGRILVTPTAGMVEGGMTPLDLPDDDLRALLAYMGGLRP